LIASFSLSNMGNCRAVNGRLRPARAVYPRHKANGFERNLARVCMVAFDFAPFDVSTICAFCLMTSAGVRMAHETSSATEEAAEWINGRGRR